MLASAKKQGFPLRVAVIATRYDLGSVPILFKKPQLYAKFLSEEDFYYWRAELLVVMPNGYGLYKAAKLPGADKVRSRSRPPHRLVGAGADRGSREGRDGTRGAARTHARHLLQRHLRPQLRLDGTGRDRRRRARPLPDRRRDLAGHQA